MDEFIKEQKQKLEEEKKKIEQRLGSLGDKDNNWQVKYPDFSKGDMEIEEDEVEEYGNMLSVSVTLKEELKKIEEAILMISKGTYGVCKNCNKDIPKERLKAYPQASTCFDC